MLGLDSVEASGRQLQGHKGIKVPSRDDVGEILRNSHCVECRMIFSSCGDVCSWVRIAITSFELLAWAKVSFRQCKTYRDHRRCIQGIS